MAGTGGVADRILSVHRSYDDPVLDDGRPSEEKARRLVDLVDAAAPGFFPHDLWGIDFHDGWLRGTQHPVIRRTYKIRHYSKSMSRIPVEGEEGLKV